jgi:branched-chain amino acid transport system substrate-binding protein
MSPIIKARFYYNVFRQSIILFLMTALPFFASQLIAEEGGAGEAQFRFDDAAERRFHDALRLYEADDFAAAASIFDSLRLTTVVHQRTTAAYVMAAKSCFRMNNFQRATDLLDSLMRRFPGTSYDDDVHYTEAISLMMEQRHRRAAEGFLHVLQISSDTALLSKSNDLLTLIVRQRLSTPDLEALYAEGRREDLRDLIAAGLAGRYRTEGQTARALSLLDERLKLPDSSGVRRELAKMRADLARTTHIAIGVLLPLLGDAQTTGVTTLANEMLEGMSLAMKEYAAGLPSTTTITLELRDSGMDSSHAVTAFTDLTRNEKVVCVLGPLFSQTVSAVAPFAGRARVPLVTPTATANGLAGGNPYIFQLNPDFDIRGRALARYAVQTRGLHTFAVLATSEPMGVSGKSFSDEVTRLGGVVYAPQSFPADVQSLRDQCAALRQAFFGDGDQAGDLNVPARLDGVYLAIDDPDEIVVILSQLRFFNIHGILLGNNEWYDRGHLDAERDFLDTLLFVTDTYIDDRDSLVIGFRKSHREFTQKHASKYTFTGYDAMRVVLDQLDPGISSGEEVRKRLSTVHRFPGLHSMISLDRGRVNSHLHLMRYCRGDLRKIDDLTVP